MVYNVCVHVYIAAVRDTFYQSSAIAAVQPLQSILLKCPRATKHNGGGRYSCTVNVLGMGGRDENGKMNELIGNHWKNGKTYMLECLRLSSECGGLDQI